MPNVVSQGSTTVPLYDPGLVRRDRQRFRRDGIPDLAQANSLYVPSGRWPSRCWLLLRRSDYNLLNLYKTFALQIDDFINPPLTFGDLYIVQARCVTRGIAAEPLAVYLVEATDAQGVLYNPWFQFPTTSQYNVSAPAYPGQFYSSTTNGGTPWTWDALCGDLWAQMGTFLGPYPHLPITPTGTPEGFVFPGVSAWASLNSIMDLLGLAITTDLTQANPAGIAVSGAADAAFAALTARYAGVMEDDYEWIDAGLARVPGTVVVLFHRMNQYYGTEETVRLDGLQWQAVPYYQVTVAGPVAGATGVAYLWSEFVVRYDIDGNILAADVAQAQAIAAERVTQYFALIFRQTLGAMRRVYIGALPFATGSLVDGVRWYMLGDGRGWRTEITRGYVLDEARYSLDLAGLGGP